MFYQTQAIRQEEKMYGYYKSPARKLIRNTEEFLIIRKSSRFNKSSIIERLQKIIKSAFTITTLGTMILTAIVLTIIILFVFYGNGQFMANPVIGW